MNKMTYILKILIKFGHVLTLYLPALLSVILAFIIEDNFSIANYIPVLVEYHHEINIALYTIILEGVFRPLFKKVETYMDARIPKIRCYFFYDKDSMENNQINEIVNLELREQPENILLKTEYSGRYLDLKKYNLKITLPTWVDLNVFSENSIFQLDDKIINNESSISNIIIDFSSLDIEDDNYKNGDKTIPLNFIINSTENLGEKELIEVKIESTKKIKICEFDSNKLEMYRKL